MASTIQFSDDNGKTWQELCQVGLLFLDNDIAYNPEDKVWVAVGFVYC